LITIARRRRYKKVWAINASTGAFQNLFCPFENSFIFSGTKSFSRRLIECKTKTPDEKEND